jgi:hypothetical protein
MPPVTHNKPIVTPSKPFVTPSKPLVNPINSFGTSSKLLVQVYFFFFNYLLALKGGPTFLEFFFIYTKKLHEDKLAAKKR